MTSYTYDTEGRKITMVDPDRGSWTYAYDSFGNLISQTDANSHVTTATYDVLGRMLTRVQPDQTDQWVYDSASTSFADIGKLTSTKSTNTVTGATVASLGYVYDSFGRLDQSSGSNATNSPTYNIQTTYDAGSRISTIIYPSGFKVTDTYNAIGNLASVSGTPAGSSTSTTLWTLNSYTAAGQVAQETLGNGVVVANTYDPNTNNLSGTLAGLSTATQTGDASNANVAKLSYTYDPLGNLSGRTDADADTTGTNVAPTPLSETFTYDALYRVTSDAISIGGTVTGTNTYAYNTLGNITSKSDTGTYAYANSAHIHAISSISCGSSQTCWGAYRVNSSFTYDANGNQLAGDGYSTVWASFNKPLTITLGSTTMTYAYDADHNRASQAGPAGTTEYFRDPSDGVFSELVTSSGSQSWTDYIFAGSELIGIHKTPATGGAYNRFFIRDQLGSIAVVTGDVGCSGLTVGGSNSCLVERDSYDAWGKRRNYESWANDTNNSVTSVTTRGFTGQEMVQPGSGFELVNMNARMFDPTTGRFMGTDPVVQDATNLQDLNAYSYVLNNPLSLTDPTGGQTNGINGETDGGGIIAFIGGIFGDIGNFLGSIGSWLGGGSSFASGSDTGATNGGYDACNGLCDHPGGLAPGDTILAPPIGESSGNSSVATGESGSSSNTTPAEVASVTGNADPTIDSAVAASLNGYTVNIGGTALYPDGSEGPSNAANSGVELASSTSSGPTTTPMLVTGYDNGYESTGKNPGDPGYGITANGTVAGPGTIAAPPNYPYGTQMYIPGYGSGTVEDRGGAIQGSHIDIWFPSAQDAINWGAQHLNVQVNPYAR